MNIVFITGSPRSGTTILGNILNCHKQIAEWYEPYYLWGSYFPDKENDIWSDRRLNDQIIQKIRREYRLFSKKANKPIVLDKSHRYAFNVKIVQDIIPEAKWIHILRDGRDVTLSIQKEWAKRKHMVKQKDFLMLFQTAINMLKRQPFWRYRLMAVLYEINSNPSINPLRYLNKAKWNGKTGWGLRFENWQKYLQTHSTLQFNAMQWVKAVEAVKKNWMFIPEQNKVEIRYEDLLSTPQNTLLKVFDTLEVDPTHDFFKSIPKLKKDNINKWVKEFTDEDIIQIKPILSPTINTLGYAPHNRW
ncbi:sulfotransferase [Thermodesulfobacteriota bacterium]